MSDDLAGWLLERIAEDEAVAREAGSGYVGRKMWIVGPGELIGDRARGVVAFGVTHGPTREHIARHDPARVLAECAAKRRIVAFLTEHHEWDEPYLLRLLALPYSDHAGYRAEWAPE